jgi:F-type H+-transporting ATPase subunit b
LGIDLPKFLGQLANFAVVFLVLGFFFFRPFLRTLDERVAKTKKGMEDAAAAEAARKAAEAEYAKRLRMAAADAAARVKEGEADGEAARQRRLALAQEEIEKAAEEAKRRIQDEREASMAMLRREAAAMAAEAMREAAAGLDAAAQKKWLQKAIERV